MNNNSMTKVMWLEEDIFISDSFIAKAKKHNLDIQCFTCWDDALVALSSNVKGWEAIILDPQCKLTRGDRPKPQRFIPQVLCDITTLGVQYNIVIPWYVFSNADPTSFEDLIIRDRAKFDADWERPYYRIGEDDIILINRIKLQTSSRERTKIRQGTQKEMFEKLSQLTSFGFSQEDVLTMEDIFISLYENKESSRCNFINLRIIIENLFKSMIRLNILPNEIKNIQGEINTSSCCRLLSAKEITINDEQYYLNEPFLDQVASNNLWNILTICHSSAHSRSINPNKRKDLNSYLEIVGTQNLLHACALMLSDIIIMYHNNLNKHLEDIVSGTCFWSKNEV